MSDLVRYIDTSPDRVTSRALARVEAAASLQRRRDLAKAELAAGRISDITRVTRHGMAAASVIAVDAELAAHIAPWAQDAIARIARSGMNSIKAQVDGLGNSFS